MGLRQAKERSLLTGLVLAEKGCGFFDHVATFRVAYDKVSLIFDIKVARLGSA